MDTKDFDKAQGHWILAKMGKRVLRPGGRELTKKLINGLNINGNDDVAEFAPGMGFTAQLALNNHPKSYVGVDEDKDVVGLLRGKLKGDNISFILGNAADTHLPDDSKDKIYGEAMLTMHADHRKSEIIKEAHRVLKKGGLYAIHELGLTPNNLNDDKKAQIQKDLAVAIRVNARPLTESEWTDLLEKEGFRVIKTEQNSMSLLETSRIFQDEGFFRALKIYFNIMRYGKARKRINEMSDTFNKYKENMNAIAIIAEKV
ncbi:MAG: methyltransferase domain-containing protein [Crocinitomicaceae bacterium]|nr:methyltransferase domain-containing protein [Crocinitomicaceae bacterium]